MSKLTAEYQANYSDRLFYDPTVLELIDPAAKLHGEAKSNPLSSAASCMNVLGSLGGDPDGLKAYLNALGINVSKVYEFPTGADVGGEVYKDKGCAVFEWIGPKVSPINEVGGSRGQNRTSIDAYVIAEIDGKVTQLLIEWKFTKGLSRPIVLNKFGGLCGNERLRRYSSVLAEMRGKGFPLAFSEEGGMGVHDFSVDHLYQLLRMTLLAKKTTPMNVGSIEVQDYRVIHLTHSGNDKINVLQSEHAKYSPGLADYIGRPFHEVWLQLLNPDERRKFLGAYWDKGIPSIGNKALREYLAERYG